MSEEAILALVQSARAAVSAGRPAEADVLLRRALNFAPRHPFINNELGVLAQRQGDAKSAASYFSIATQADANHPALWANLASALHDAGRFEEERDAIERALAIDPRHLASLLQKGALLEATTPGNAAVAAYRNALATIPEGVSLPDSVRPAVERARQLVDMANTQLRALIDQRVESVFLRGTPSDQRRASKCIDVLTGRSRIYVPEPTFMFFPGISIIDFFDRTDFPWISALDRATDDIRSELLGVLASDSDDLEPYVSYPDGVPLDQWKELNRSRRWSAYYLWNQGEAQVEHLARCPATAEALSQTPQCVVPGRAPTAFFSILDSRTHIPPHSGVTNTRLTVHLPLIVPERCRFRVGAETREWVEGQAWVFDDTINHEAWNDSDSPRAILLFDVWNHLLSPIEQEVVAIASGVYTEFHHGITHGEL